MARIVLPIVFLLAALGLCRAQAEPTKLSDEEITKLLVGKWEHVNKFGAIRIRTLEHYKADGTLDREDTINDSQKIHVKSTWSVKDGTLTVVVVEGPPGKGTTVKGKVVAIDDKTQRLELEAGAKITKTRIKP